MKMKTKQTVVDAMRHKINEDLEFKEENLQQSILGTIKSAHLQYQKYNLDQHYIMHEKVQEYKEGCSRPYSQFVMGMVPEKVLRNLGKYDILKIQQQVDAHCQPLGVPRNNNANEEVKRSEGSENARVAERMVIRTSDAEPSAVSQEDVSSLAESDVAPPVYERRSPHETATQLQARKWAELHNNALDFLIAMRHESQAHVAFEESLRPENGAVIQ